MSPYFVQREWGILYDTDKRFGNLGRDGKIKAEHKQKIKRASDEGLDELKSAVVSC